MDVPAKAGLETGATFPAMAWAFDLAGALDASDTMSGFILEHVMDYLLKTEPTEYSFADLQRDKQTLWDGVSNPVALKHLRGMKPGERLVIYETGDHKSAVGTASVSSVEASDPRNPAVKIKAGKALAKPISLADIKAQPLFADSPLVRQGRLSVVPLTAAQYKFLTGE